MKGRMNLRRVLSSILAFLMTFSTVFTTNFTYVRAEGENPEGNEPAYTLRLFNCEDVTNENYARLNVTYWYVKDGTIVGPGEDNSPALIYNTDMVNLDYTKGELHVRAQLGENEQLAFAQLRTDGNVVNLNTDQINALTSEQGFVLEANHSYEFEHLELQTNPQNPGNDPVSGLCITDGNMPDGQDLNPSANYSKQIWFDIAYQHRFNIAIGDGNGNYTRPTGEAKLYYDSPEEGEGSVEINSDNSPYARRFSYDSVNGVFEVGFNRIGNYHIELNGERADITVGYHDIIIAKSPEFNDDSLLNDFIARYEENVTWYVKCRQEETDNIEIQAILYYVSEPEKRAESGSEEWLDCFEPNEYISISENADKSKGYDYSFSMLKDETVILEFVFKNGQNEPITDIYQMFASDGNEEDNDQTGFVINGDIYLDESGKLQEMQNAEYRKRFDITVDSNFIFIPGLRFNSNDPVMEIIPAEGDFSFKKYNQVSKEWDLIPSTEAGLILNDRGAEGFYCEVSFAETGTYRLFYQGISYVEFVVDTPQVGLFKTAEYDLSQWITPMNWVGLTNPGEKIYLCHRFDDDAYDYSFELRDYSFDVDGGDYIFKTSEDKDWKDNEYISFSDDLTEITLNTSQPLWNFSINVDVFKTNKLSQNREYMGTYWVGGYFQHSVNGLVMCDYIEGDQFIEVNEDGGINYGKFFERSFGEDIYLKLANHDGESLGTDENGHIMGMDRDIKLDDLKIAWSQLVGGKMMWIISNGEESPFGTLEYDEQIDGFVFRPAFVGRFRIYQNPSGYNSLENDKYNFVEINVVEEDKIAYFSTTKGGDPLGDSIYNVPNKGLTLYMNASSKDNVADVKILGYYMGDPEWDDSTQKYTNLKTTNYDVLKYNATAKTITVPEDLEFWDVGFVVQYTYKEDKHVEYKEVRLFVDRSDKGLVVLDWLEFEGEFDNPIWQSFQRGEYAYYNKALQFQYRESRYALLGNCTEDRIDEPDYTSVESASKNRADYTIKKLSGNSWVNTNEIEMVYVGGNDGVSDEFKDLWRIDVNGVGYYRIIAKDGTYVAIGSYMPTVGVYTSSTKFDPSTYVGSEVFTTKDKVNTYYLYGHDFANGLYIQNFGGINIYEENGEVKHFGRLSEDQFEDGIYEYLDFEKVGTDRDLLKITLKKVNCGYEFMFIMTWETEQGWTYDSATSEILWLNQSQKGIVLNPNVEFDERLYPDMVPTGNLNPGHEYEYTKYIEVGVSDTIQFMLGNNMTEGWVNEKSNVAHLATTAGITVQRYNEEEGKWINADANSYSFRYIDKYVYETTFEEVGLYRFLYKDGTYVEINVLVPVVGFYYDVPNASHGSYVFNFTRTNMTDNVTPTAEEASGNRTMSFFAVVDKRQIEFESYEVNIYAVNKENNEKVLIFANNSDSVEGITVKELEDQGGIGYFGEEVGYGPQDDRALLLLVIYLDNTATTNISDYMFELQVVGKENGQDVGYIYSWMNIDKCNLEDCEISSEFDAVEYNGSYQSPAPTKLTADGYDLDSSDYDLYCQNNCNAGEATAVIVGKGNFYGVVEVPFEITPVKLSKYEDKFTATSIYSKAGAQNTVFVDDDEFPDYLYGNYDAEFGYKKQDDTYVLASELEFDKTYYVKICGKGNVDSTPIYVSYTYEKASLGNVGIVGNGFYYATYNGQEQLAKPVIRENGVLLVEGVDYKVLPDKDKDNTQAGTYVQKIMGINNYTGSLPVTMVIESASISKASVTGVPTSVKWEDADGIKPTVTLNKVVLEEGTDYTVSMDKAVGKCSLVIEGKGNYTGTITKTVTVTAATQIKSAKIKDGVTFTFNGQTLMPKPENIVVMSASGEVDASNYEITSTSVNAGKGTATITGKAEAGYSGKVTVSYTIAPATVTEDMITVDDCVYSPATGNKQPVTVKVGDYTGVEGKDYTLTYANTNAAGEATVTIKTKGNFAVAAFTKTYNIAKCDFDQNTTDVKPDLFYGDTEGQAVDCKVIFNYSDDFVLKEGTDYQLTQIKRNDATQGYVDAESVVAGTYSTPNEYRLTYSGIGNYEGDKTIDIKVAAYNKTTINDFRVEGIPAEPVVYNASEQTFDAITVKDGETTLSKDTDYRISYSKNVNVGKAYVTITGIGDYEGTITKTFTINPLLPAEGQVTCEESEAAYINDNGKVVLPSITLKNGDNVLTEKTDYTYKFEKVNAIAGNEVKVTVTFKGNYSGKLSYTLSPVKGIDVERADLQITGMKDFVYTGKEIKQKLTVKYKGKTLKEGTDYKLGYGDTPEGAPKINAGYCNVYVNLCGKYASKNIELESFEITMASLSKASVTMSSSKITYNSDDFDNQNFEGYGQGIVTAVKYNGILLTEGVDYKVVLSDNRKPGTAYATIIPADGSKNFEGELVKPFTISGKVDINDSDIYVWVANEAWYSPAGAKPDVVVKYKEAILEEGKDYTLTCANNKKLFEEGGVSTVTIKGKGSYTGTYATKYTFKVVKGNLEELYNSGRIAKAGVMYSSWDEIYYIGTTYTGKEQKPDPKIKVDNKALKMGVDYKVTYKNHSTLLESDTVINAGEYDIKIEGVGNYAGSVWCGSEVVVGPADINKAKVKSVSKVEYVGDAFWNPQIVTQVTFNGVELTSFTDYIVSYDYPITEKTEDDFYQFCNKSLKLKKAQMEKGNKIDDWYMPGKKTAYLFGCDLDSAYQPSNFTGVKKITYTINGLDLSKAKINNPTPTIDFNPNEEYISDDVLNKITVDYVVDGKTIRLANGTDYEIVNAVNKAGNVTVTFKGKGMFTGKKTTSIKVTPVKPENDLGKLAISNADSITYNAKGAKLTGMVLSYDNVILVEGKDYTVSYANNKAVAESNAAKAPTATIKFKGNYSGSVKKTFSITPKHLTENDIVFTFKDAKNTYKPSLTIKDGTTAMKLNKDYKVSYEFASDTIVRIGNQYVMYKDDDAIPSNATVLAGTEINITVTAMGNYDSFVTYHFVYTPNYPMSYERY